MISVVGSRIDLNPWIEGHGPLNADYTWKEVNFSLNGKSNKGGSLSFEIAKRETTIQSKSLIKGERGPLIWLHFEVSNTRCWESQETSHQDPQSPESRKHFLDKRLVTTSVHM
jgi:hypothetical protein